MTFRFRAAAALDVRRKQEDAALIELAKAEAAMIAARTQAESARDVVNGESERLVELQRHGSEAWRVQWHRAWIEKQQREADDRARELTDRQSEAAAATQAAREAVKKRRVLERLRDRAWHRHQRVMHEQHVKDMNDLATLRFVAQLAEEGGTRAD